MGIRRYSTKDTSFPQVKQIIYQWANEVIHLVGGGLLRARNYTSQIYVFHLVAQGRRKVEACKLDAANGDLFSSLTVAVGVKPVNVKTKNKP